MSKDFETIKVDESTSAPSNEQIEAAIANVNPDVVLRNVAFWLDVAIARGRWYDHNSVKRDSDAVPETETDN